jgi:hypothetical protein
MKDGETRETKVEETPSEKKTTEKIHEPGTAEREDSTATHTAGTPAKDETKTKVEKK